MQVFLLLSMINLAILSFLGIFSPFALPGAAYSVQFLTLEPAFKNLIETQPRD